MAVKIRLTRMGSTHRPFYRLVVADSRTRRDGRVVDTIGYYNPLPANPDIKVDNEKALSWLQNGAQASDTARSLLRTVGVWQRFQFLKQGMSPEQADAEVSKILSNRPAPAAKPKKEAPKPAAVEAPVEAAPAVAAEEPAVAEAPVASAVAEEAPPAEATAAESETEEAPAAPQGE